MITICSPQAPLAPAASLQGVFSACDKASDKGSDAGRCGSGGSGGNTSSGGAHNCDLVSGNGESMDGSGSASGSGSEQQSLSDEQGFSTPTQRCSISGDPSLPGGGRPCLKRCSLPLRCSHNAGGFAAHHAVAPFACG